MEKTFIAGIPQLTKNKKLLLDQDYENYQWWMQFGIDKGLLSAFKADKKRYQKKINYRDYPLPIRSQSIKNWFRTKDTKLARHWIKIPNSKLKGQGVWLPLQFHQPLPAQFNIRDSLIVKKNGKYYFHMIIDIPVLPCYVPETTLGIDLGLKNPFTIVNIDTRETQFLGKDWKETKGKYFYLRQTLRQNKKFKTIKKIGDKEKRKTNTILHRITKEIIDSAKESNAAIVIGKLKNLPKNKGKKMNKKLTGFSHYKIVQFLTYKAKEAGVPFVTVNEAFTSKHCSVCGSTGKRRKNWFSCQTCGHSDNADRNAAFNIGKRGFSYMLESGVHAYAQKPITIAANG